MLILVKTSCTIYLKIIYLQPSAQAPPYSYPSQLPGPPMGGPPPNAYAYQAQSQVRHIYITFYKMNDFFF